MSALHLLWEAAHSLAHLFCESQSSILQGRSLKVSFIFHPCKSKVTKRFLMIVSNVKLKLLNAFSLPFQITHLWTELSRIDTINLIARIPDFYKWWLFILNFYQILRVSFYQWIYQLFIDKMKPIFTTLIIFSSFIHGIFAIVCFLTFISISLPFLETSNLKELPKVHASKIMHSVANFSLSLMAQPWFLQSMNEWLKMNPYNFYYPCFIHHLI